MQHQNAQIVRDIFGKLIVADFQTFAEFDGNLVALFERQAVDHGDQCASG